MAVLNQAREAVMLFGSSFRHYRLIRRAITEVAWMGVCHVSCHKPYSSIGPRTINNIKYLHIKDNYMLQSGMFFPTSLSGESAIRPKARVALVHRSFAAQG